MQSHPWEEQPLNRSLRGAQHLSQFDSDALQAHITHSPPVLPVSSIHPHRRESSPGGTHLSPLMTQELGQSFIWPAGLQVRTTPGEIPTSDICYVEKVQK